MFKNYFNTALRNLWRSKIFSFINISGLSVGLACCMLIILYSKDEISYDRFLKNSENIYRVTATLTSPDGNVHKTGNTGMMPGPAFTRGIPEIAEFVRLQKTTFKIKQKNEIFSQEALYADSNFFSVLSFPLIAGNPKTALNDIHSVVISEDLAEKYFGKKDVVGQVLELGYSDNFEPFIVSAVAKRSPQNSSVNIDMLLPMKYGQTIWDNDEWVNFFLNTFVVLKKDADIKKVEAKFAGIFHTEAAAQLKEIAEQYGFKDKLQFGLQPILQMHLSKDFPSGYGLKDSSSPMYSYILSGIALFILLIACINFVNLTIAHSLKRSKEIGIRKVIGGQRKQLMAQFLGESLVLSLIAFLVAIFLVKWTLPFFNTLSNKALSFSYLLDPQLILGYVTLFLITGLLAGFYPAIVLSRFNPVQTLYGRVRLAGKNYLSKGLVVFQFTLATFLIVATAIIYSQFNYLMNFDLGYNDKNVAIVNTGQIDLEKLNVFKNELLKSASIIGVAADQGGRQDTYARLEDGKEINFNLKHIDENYFNLFQIPIVKGRNFSSHFISDTVDAAIVNESFVKTAGWKDPLGKQIDFFYKNKKYKVVGVIKDYHYASLTEKIGPQFFTTGPRSTYKKIYIKLKPASTTEGLHYIESAFKKMFPVQPYDYNFIDAQNATHYESESKWKQVITFGAALTIFISCIGLFGLTMLSAEKRTKEIGIRKVLGASASVIAGKLSGDFLKLVIIATVIASPIAWWVMNSWLQNYPYRITVSVWLFGFAAIFVLLIALITVSFQAIKAAMANPVKSLRSE